MKTRTLTAICLSALLLAGCANEGRTTRPGVERTPPSSSTSAPETPEPLVTLTPNVNVDAKALEEGQLQRTDRTWRILDYSTNSISINYLVEPGGQLHQLPDVTGYISQWLPGTPYAITHQTEGLVQVVNLETKQVILDLGPLEMAQTAELGQTENGLTNIAAFIGDNTTDLLIGVEEALGETILTRINLEGGNEASISGELRFGQISEGGKQMTIFNESTQKIEIIDTKTFETVGQLPSSKACNSVQQLDETRWLTHCQEEGLWNAQILTGNPENPVVRTELEGTTVLTTGEQPILKTYTNDKAQYYKLNGTTPTEIESAIELEDGTVGNLILGSSSDYTGEWELRHVLPTPILLWNPDSNETTTIISGEGAWGRGVPNATEQADGVIRSDDGQLTITEA